jgi:hypothetical protein
MGMRAVKSDMRATRLLFVHLPWPHNFAVSVAVAIFFLFYSVILILPGSSLLKDPDPLWHIRTGQWLDKSKLYLRQHGGFNTILYVVL